MKKQISFRQYRAMDLFMLTALVCVCETLITLGATRWFPGEPYTLSVTPAVTAITMVRWGGYAAIPAALGALAFCLVSGATPAQLAIYCVGNLAALLLALPLRGNGWTRLARSAPLAMLYGLLTALVMQAGRAALALLMGNDAVVCVGFFATDALSAVFAAMIVWIARRLDGVLEEQRHYLKRIADEMEKERNSAQGAGFEP